jgi:hypothetical protein
MPNGVLDCFGKIFRVKELCHAAYINIGHDRLMYPTIEYIQFTFSHSFALVFFSFHFLTIRSSSRRHNLLGYCGSNLSSIQTSLDRRRNFIIDWR